MQKPRSSPQRAPSPTRRPRHALAALLLLLGLSAGPGQAAYIAVGATVNDKDATPTTAFIPTLYTGDLPVADGATLGDGLSQFDVQPPSGQGHLIGHAQGYPYQEGITRSTVASGLLIVSDTYHITGAIPAPLQGALLVHLKGSMTSNDYIDALGRHGISAQTYLSADVFQGVDSAGNEIRAKNVLYQADRAATGPDPTCVYDADVCLLGTQVDLVATLPLQLTDARRDIDLSVLINVGSFLGGSYNIGDPLSGQLLSIELQLPPGLNYTADGGWFAHLSAVPEPAPLVLALAGMAALALRRPRRAP